MVALKNGVIRNKDGHSFDRSTGTWKNQNAAENPDVVKEDTSNSNSQDTTTEKQTDAKEEQPGNKNEQPGNKNEQPGNKNEPTDAKTKETPAETSKPRVIQYNIDGKQVYISSNDWPHFNELRAQLASGTTLNDDLIRKIKPILAEAHL